MNEPSQIKKNVSVFNQDVLKNKGYRYTTHASLSSYLANLRLTKATIERIDSTVKTIIDIGCGDGKYTHELSMALPGITFSGTDAADNAISIAKKNFPNISFHVSDVLSPVSMENRYDLAILRGLLHHLPSQAVPLKNTADIAIQMLIIEPNGNSPVLKIIEKTSKYHRKHEEQSFSTNKLTKWCKEAGWEISSVSYVGLVPFFFPSFLAKILYFLQPFVEKTPCLTNMLVRKY